MKKVLLFLGLLGFIAIPTQKVLCLSANDTSTSVSVSVPVSTPTFEEKVYVMEDNDAQYTLTLTSEAEFTLLAIKGENGSFEIKGTYTLVDNVLDLYVLEDYLLSVTLNDDGTFSEYIGEVVEEPSIEYNAKVVIIESKNGEIYVDIVEGNVGDLVTITVSPDVLYQLQSINVNGVILEPKKDIDGNEVYQFQLVEGSNTISASFEISDEKLIEIAGLLEKIKNRDWKAIFSLENILNIIYFVFATLTTSGLCVTLLKNKKLKAKTMDDVNNNVTNILETKIPEQLIKFLEDFFGPFDAKFLEKIDGVVEVARVLTRCMILMQEGTPEARLAILREIESIKTDEEELSNQVKKLINDEMAKKEKELQDKEKALAALREENEITTTIDEVPHL